jgi:uncharacterized membrane protein
MKLAVAYLATVAFFVIVDIAWLGFIAKDFYRASIGHLMGDGFNIPAAIVFYLIYAAGIMFFAINPALSVGDVMKAAMLGLAFGFFAYATYDLTNLATLRDWPLGMTLADIAWGSVLTGATAAFGFWVATRLSGALRAALEHIIQRARPCNPLRATARRARSCRVSANCRQRRMSCPRQAEVSRRRAS